MKKGAVGFLDALGFKGIWNRPGITGNDVIEKMVSLRSKVEERLNPNIWTSDPRRKPEWRVAFISDSVFLCAWYEDARPDQERLLLNVVENMAAVVLRYGLEGDPVLVYRGCIAYGDFEIDEDRRFIVGEAVDEASEGEGKAQGAFVWMGLSAKKQFLPRDQDPTGRRPLFMEEYPVPLKCKRTLESYILNPLQLFDTTQQKAAAIEAMWSMMNKKKKSIAVKRENTLRYLSVVEPQAMDNACLELDVLS